MKNRVYDMALEVLDEDIYDIQEYFSNDYLAAMIQNIIVKMNLLGMHRRAVSVKIGALQVNVMNAGKDSGGSFVSVSDDIATSVSRSLVEITDISRPCNKDEVRTLIEMVNEAWFRLYN